MFLFLFPSSFFLLFFPFIIICLITELELQTSLALFFYPSIPTFFPYINTLFFQLRSAKIAHLSRLLLRDKVICAGIEAENKKICVHLSQLWVLCIWMLCWSVNDSFCVMSFGGSGLFLKRKEGDIVSEMLLVYANKSRILSTNFDIFTKCQAELPI